MFSFSALEACWEAGLCASCECPGQLCSPPGAKLLPEGHVLSPLGSLARTGPGWVGRHRAAQYLSSDPGDGPGAGGRGRSVPTGTTRRWGM